MAHQQQREFCERMRRTFPETFTDRRVLDIGSWNFNGTNRDLFTGGTYTGCDVAAGPNVDIVCPAHRLDFPRDSFDTIISTEALEHDPFAKQTLQHTTWLLRPGGFYLFTCGFTGRGEHGTTRSNPDQNLASVAGLPEFAEHYRNLSIEDVLAALDMPRLFSWYAFEVDELAHDLRFWGFKR